MADVFSGECEVVLIHHYAVAHYKGLHLTGTGANEDESHWFRRRQPEAIAKTCESRKLAIMKFVQCSWLGQRIHTR